MARLDEAQIEERLAGLAGWSRQGEAIAREFAFEDFVAAIDFVNRLAGPAEQMGHHPDLAVSWNRVTVTISTHSEGGLTAADFELARAVDGLA